MQERVRRFRALVREKMGERRGRGVRYPEALRVEAVACAREGLASGASLGEVASRLGIGIPTLSRWLEQGGVVGLREVEVLEPCLPAGGVVSAGVVLVTPSGHRVEGLELAQLAELLRALG